MEGDHNSKVFLVGMPISYFYEGFGGYLIPGGLKGHKYVFGAFCIYSGAKGMKASVGGEDGCASQALNSR